jgi:predicted glycosyltransferase
LRIWIDIENPPQVQYLLPFTAAFERAGADVVVTARDTGITLDLLRTAGVDFNHVGQSYGKTKWRKALGLLGRVRALESFFRGRKRPGALVCAGRASALVARRRGVPIFNLSDYEFVDLRIDRLTSSYVVFPDVIERAAFLEQGVRPDRLIPYRGLKEDISFASIDLHEVAPHLFPGVEDDGPAKVLFRPPAEESHYYSSASGRLAHELLEHLAGEESAQVILSPRYEWQADYVDGFSWSNPPVVLREPVPFVPLLLGVDAVISAGGTMLREAAYVGVPAYSIFQSRLGGVDRHLAGLGRLTLIGSAADFGKLRPEKRDGLEPLAGNPGVLDELVQAVLARSESA